MTRIFITGTAGFIGFHFAKLLLEEGYRVHGFDGMTDYYDVTLKEQRHQILLQNKAFTKTESLVEEGDILWRVAEDFQPEVIVHLAAQAGVRYSLKNPYAYMESNLIGFLNIIELCRHNDVEGLIYASSSSVYGANTKIPFSTDDQTDQPIALYGVTKKANELMAHAYSHLYELHTTGLRYFTVYGPWGRPDMAMYIFTDRILKGEPIPVFNHGNMRRDFTFIEDIIAGTRSAMNKNYPCEVFNLGNNKSENLMDMIGIIEENLGIKANIDFQPMQPGDVPESVADIDKSTKMLNYRPTTNIDEGIPHFIDWYKYYCKL